MRSMTLDKFGYDVHFKKLTAEQLKADGSFNLTDDKGQVIAIVAVPVSAFKKGQISSICDAMNQSIGK